VVVRPRALVCLVLASACGRVGFAPGSGAADVGPGGMDRRALYLDRIAFGEQLTDFPLLVVLDDTRLDRTLIGPGASELRFFDSSNAPLPFEIEQLGAVGGEPLLAWVDVTIVDVSTVIYVQAGQVDGIAQPAMHWPSSYEAVWHMVDGSDALGSHTMAVGTTSPSTGFIGGARGFAPGSNAALIASDSPGFAFPAITCSAWMHPSDTMTFHEIVGRQTGIGDFNDFYFGIDATEIFFSIDPSPLAAGAIGAGEWHHIAATYDGTTMVVYLDGSAIVTGPGAMPMPHDSNPIVIGGDAYTATHLPAHEFFLGDLDEVRLDHVVRDAAWIAAEAATGRDAIISYGAP
jgi:hypothetical protein